MRRIVASVALVVLGLVGLLGSSALGDTPTAPRTPAPPTKDGRTVVVEIAQDIDLGLASYVKRVLDDVKPGDLVVFHIDTFGGRIDAAVQIRDEILGCKAHTVAFVDRRAISAGALIALSTDTIVMTSGATIGAATPVQLEGGKMQPVEAKVVSYFRKEMKATAEAKGRRGDIAEAMVDASVEVPGLDGKDTTLTLTTDEALKYKIAAFQAENLDTVREKLAGSPAVIKPGINWAERVARFLSEPAISSLLMTLGMLGLGIELWAPGHAIAGTLGVLCLLAFFFGHYVVNLAGWEELLLFLGGVAAVGFEVFFWSGHGMLAIVGILAIVASLIMAIVNAHPAMPLDVSWHLPEMRHDFNLALKMVFGSMFATAAAMALLSRWLPASRLGRRLVLSQTIDAVASPAVAQARGATPLVGQTGIAETTLRPAGKATVGGRRLDVVTEGGYIEQGTEIAVVAVDDGRVVVRALPRTTEVRS